MQAFFAIVFTVLVLIGAAIALFFVTIHPIWAIIDVAIARNKSSGEKVLWIILMFILWGVASLIYGLIFATRPLAVTTRVLFVGALVLTLALVTFAIVAPRAVDRLRDTIRMRRLEVQARSESVRYRSESPDERPRSRSRTPLSRPFAG